MRSSYQLIFRVSFEHAFFVDGKLRAMHIVPVAASHAMLLQAGMQLRAEENGIAAFGDAAAVERLRGLLAEAGTSLTMAFQVFFTDPHFFDYTVPAWPAGQLLLLDTAAAVPDDSGRRMLHATPNVPASAFVARDHADLLHILGKRPLSPAPAMVLQLAVSSALLDAADPRERHFHARFEAASSRWKYCVFGAGETKADIVDLAGDMEFEHYPDVALADKRHADVFVSKRAIPMREVYGARFQLRTAAAAGNQVLIKRMPNASVGKRSRECRDVNGIPYSEIFVSQSAS